MSASSLSSISTPAIGNVYLPASQIPSPCHGWVPATPLPLPADPSPLLVRDGSQLLLPLQRGSREGSALPTPPSQGMAADLLLDKVEPDPQPDIPLGIGVEDRIDGTRGTAVAASQHLHQGAA